ncbi:MAG: hypothetical protein ACE5R6_21990 [Candidatus Heimdallarchaeota archaeon]
MFSRHIDKDEVEEFVTEYLDKKVGKNRIVRIRIIGPIDGDDLSIGIRIKDLTREEAVDISHELGEIFDKADLKIPIGVSNQKGLSVFS